MERIRLISERGNNMKFNNKVPKWLIILGFVAGIVLMIASTVETVMLFKSMATGWISYMFAAVGFCIDIGKTVTFALFVYFLIKKKFWPSLLFLIFYILCLIISMVASQSLDLNKVNEIQNKTVISSDTYKMNMTTFESSSNDITYYRNKIESVTNSEQARLEQSKAPLLEQLKTAQANRWLTTPHGSPREGVDVINKKIAALPSSIASDVANEIKEIEGIMLGLNSNQKASRSNIDNLTDGAGIKTTAGIIAFAEWLNPENPIKAVAMFNIFKTVFREILGTLLILLYNYQFDTAANGKQARLQDKKKPSKQADTKPSNLILLKKNKQPSKSKISEEEIQKYLNCKKQNQAMGYKKIADKIGIAQNKGYEITKILKSRGIIKYKAKEG